MALLIEETANQTESQQLTKVGFKINGEGHYIGRLITCPFDELHFYLI